MAGWVAYSIDSRQPIAIQKWPGPDELVNKVPTKLWYRAGCKKPVGWGLQCPGPRDLERGMDVVDCFKLYLEPDLIDGLESSSELGFFREENVHVWYIDFLTALREHIMRHIKTENPEEVVGDWALIKVKYIFSFPTTWLNTPMVDTFKSLVLAAGYGACPSHSVEIKMTEAAAAAVYSAKNFKKQRLISGLNGGEDRDSSEEERLREGDVILVCDAGGGTTDVSVVRVNSIEEFARQGDLVEEVLELSQVDCVKGEPVGSVQIDQAFQKNTEDRLEQLDWSNKDSRLSVKEIAHDLTKAEFQDIKKGFTGSVHSEIPVTMLRIHSIPKDCNHQGAGISRGRMTVSNDDIRWMFNQQIDRIFELIDYQLQTVEEFENVTHFVISGGLGSSEYVQQRIHERYERGGAGKRILISDDPQLAVCKGLVLDRIHRVKHGHSMISTRSSRFSYGILYNKEFSPSIYRRRPEGLEIDGKYYLVDQIHWLLKRGDPVNHRKNISEKFTYVFPGNAGSSDITWTDSVVMSRAYPDSLPEAVNRGDTQIIWDIESRVSLQTIKKYSKPVKKKRFDLRPTKEKPHRNDHVIQYEVRLIIRSTYVKFEVWVGDVRVGYSDEILGVWQYSSDTEGLHAQGPRNRGNRGRCAG
ncbi:hypothetical protein FQN50_007832 [Emmonsiellopsis sp. PD_5]|nr:hypothetical protein FQN50_007832 [Emmonsiellopsis sp. PD_5]